MSHKWTLEDFRTGKCDLDDIGLEKPSEAASGDGVSPTNSIQLDDGESLSERIRRDAVSAYVKLGGVEYLKDRPELLDKALIKALAPDPKPVEPMDPNTANPFPWLTKERLLVTQLRQEMAKAPDSTMAASLGLTPAELSKLAARPVNTPNPELPAPDNDTKH